MNTGKLTRRQLAAAAAALLAVLAIAQAPPAPNPAWYEAAVESHKENSAILAQFQVSMFVEPAFHFKA